MIIFTKMIFSQTYKKPMERKMRKSVFPLKMMKNTAKLCRV